MFVHRVNNIELNIKQNIYIGMEVISLIPPCYCIYKQLTISTQSPKNAYKRV